MLEPRVTGIPIPRPTPESLPYWEGTRIGELRYQRCDSCGRANFGPGLACRHCRTHELTWVVGSGLGTVYSWTVVWRPQTPAFEVPYAPVIVRLDDGYDMVSSLVGVDHAGIHDGQRVMVEFHPISPSITLAFFRPASDLQP